MVDPWDPHSARQLPKLKADQRLGKLEVVLCSHAHFDHYDGVYSILQRDKPKLWTLDNEELETAKEELQSANEELSTINEQLQRRNQELDQVNNDLTNLLSSTSIPVAMVGGDLRLRRITDPAKKAMNLLPTGIGKPLSDLNITAIVPDVEQVIADVIENVRPAGREVRDRDGRW